jgi:hypothetical protein
MSIVGTVNTRFIRINKMNISILLFLVLMTVIHILKPKLMYNDDGGFRPFGVGYRHKTVIPIWVISIILSIFTYTAVLYYINYM